MSSGNTLYFHSVYSGSIFRRVTLPKKSWQLTFDCISSKGSKIESRNTVSASCWNLGGARGQLSKNQGSFEHFFFI